MLLADAVDHTIVKMGSLYEFPTKDPGFSRGVFFVFSKFSILAFLWPFLAFFGLGS